MSYWINLQVPEPSEPYYYAKDYGMHCSWNYYKLMNNLPCSWVKNWRGRQAKELIEPIKLSLAKLESYPMRYKKYQANPERKLGTIYCCHEILLKCLEHFEEAPDLIIEVD